MGYDGKRILAAPRIEEQGGNVYSFIEIVSQLEFHDACTLDKIAWLDDRQIAFVYFRARDDKGDLIRESDYNKVKGSVWDSDEYIPRAFDEMYLDLKRKQGAPEELIPKLWANYIKDNPGVLEHCKGVFEDKENGD